MQNRLILCWLCAATLLAACTSKSEKKDMDTAARVNNYWTGQIDSIHASLDSLLAKAEKREATKKLQIDFFRARHHFKRVEALTLFYFPEDYERLNGPVLLRAEEFDNKVIEPMGFQVIEEKIHSDSIDYAAISAQAKGIQVIMKNLQQMIRITEIPDANVFEAARTELLTLMALGISGFDSPIAFRSISEARSTLEGLEHLVGLYADRLTDQNIQQEWHRLLHAAYAYLDRPVDFDHFDRARFIVNHINPISRQAYRYQQAAQVPNNKIMMALNPEKETFFEPGVFHIDHFAPTYNRRLKPEVAELGRMLFFDPLLSGNNNRACASCHKPGLAFTDGKARSVAFDFKGEVARNAPTLINSGYQKSQFWDQRVAFIEDQVNNVIADPIEMHGRMEESAQKLLKSEAYRALFKTAFGQDTITKRQIQTALASYIRSLSGLNARFDQYMRGDTSALTPDAITGFNLFMGKGKCGTCHFMPLFNGTVPPHYLETESEVLGVPAKADTAHAQVDPDEGKRRTYGRDLHKHAFKTNTVRNAALTAPYMHNGVYKTLDQVLDFYNRGGGAGIGIELSNQSLPPDALNLNKQEMKQIISFIESLTDTTDLTRMPAVLPAVHDAKLDKRKVGGEY